MNLKVVVLALVAAVITSCGGDGKKEEKVSAPVEEQKAVVEETDPMKDKGIGPITSIELGDIDQNMADEGKAIFAAKCAACHKISKRLIGPAMVGVTERRTPEWIMNMILNPEVMVVENPIAKKLLAEYIAPMANQSLTEEEARKILEYFRTKTSATDE
ncbi:c-type cytochrome [Lutibacter sp.]|uniref:c-type cytochrome n=1 Tax=Lutibacter sp. TaxID=1925666 RepID=UPI0035671A7D